MTPCCSSPTCDGVSCRTEDPLWDWIAETQLEYPDDERDCDEATASRDAA